MQLLRRFTFSSPYILLLLLGLSMQMSVATARPLRVSSYQVAQSLSSGTQTYNPDVELLRQMVRDGRLAPTVHVLNSLAPTTIVQFPLLPSGIKNAFPQATGLVTIVRGNRDNAFSDTITVDVQKMPPNITFTIFYIQFASKPFGNVEYVADLTTRGDGSGETIFQNIAFVAMAMDARNPGTSQDGQEGTTSGTNLEHLGMWFSSLADAQKVLNDGTLTGTIFDGGNPPLHAGPQAMTDGQTAPVF
ncbi:MAG TPA: hypothetical protein VJ761_16520 [Ktedonobacteraceae bacterium]|nr:hypothetical protein [Ktedonobacteraceae bacterium]